MSKTQPARGMRDFLPADIRKRNYVIGIIKEVYESYGFEPLETPAVENLETLTGKYGEEGNQLMFKILKRGEKLDIANGEKGLSDLALRYDLTVPLARVVANYRNELPRFFKRYQIQPVWRADRPARGRFREFYQCDVDAIGSNSMIVEAELISAVSEILQRLGFDDFVIKLNNRKILTGLLDYALVPSDKHTEFLTSLDKLDKIGTHGVIKELVERGIKEKIAQAFLKIFKDVENYYEQGIDDYTNVEERLTAWNEIWFPLLDDMLKNNEEGTKGKEEIRSLLEFSRLSSARGKIKFEVSLARGLSYYTGAIFEINVPDFAGSLGGGGR